MRNKIGEVEVDEMKRIVSAGILDFWGIPLVAGRDFEEDDTWGSEKLIVNQTFVKLSG